MILAGGQGSRLGVLTAKVAKPAVPFGGKYRIIDFPLSNCAHSGIERVGVLTQYRPFELNNYLGNGNAWDLDSRGGGVFILPPYARAKGADWYSGTADAIYQNLNFIEMSDPDYVLILSGDHIYAMDYSKMLDAHIAKGAEATIGVIRVPMEEASRFGILDAEPDGRITRFTEKPAQPTSDLASMGIYIFTKDFLRDYLVADAKREDSSHDFGKDIIPKMLSDGAKLFSYSFDGYWKDVGTIESLWKSNMDILGEKPLLDMRESENRIYARNYSHPCSYISPEAEIEDSYVAEGSRVYGKVHHSVISTGCVIEKGAEIYDSFVMPNSVIETRSVIRYSIVGEDAVVHANARIGDDPEFYSGDKWGIAVVGKDKAVEQNKILLPGEIF
jgi:glucose-1-phosphate adenylyltransferase